MSATTTPAAVVTEPTAWLRGTAGAQLRRAARLGLDPHDAAGPMIVAPLVGRMSIPGSREDRTCDRCGRYCGPAELFHPLAYRAAVALVLIGGLCTEHAAAEGVRA
ncbi:MAG: hypothetical protein IPL93_08320 [Actinomycetales bacterium]|nr:hypothetical protein [Actinomycetales bacterium]